MEQTCSLKTPVTYVCTYACTLHTYIHKTVSFINVGFDQSQVCARGACMVQHGTYTEAQAVMFQIYVAIDIHVYTYRYTHKICVTAMAMYEKLLSESIPVS